LFQGGGARADFRECRFPQKSHSVLSRCFTNFRSGFLLQNQFANTVCEIEKLVNRGATLVSRAATLDAAFAFIKSKAGPFFEFEAARFKLFLRITNPLLARIADYPHQPLRQNAVQCADEVVALHTPVE